MKWPFSRFQLMCYGWTAQNFTVKPDNNVEKKKVMFCGYGLKTDFSRGYKPVRNT